MVADDQPIGEVTQIIEKWLTLQSSGLKISVEELCQDSPELIDEVRQELSSIRKMDAVLDETNTPSPVELGQRTGRANCENDYILQKLLGHGGCSEVYLAHDKKLGRDVAVKFLRPDTADIEKLQKRLKQEAEITSQLNHPGIVAIHASGEHEGAPFYCMQYVQGESLSQTLAHYHLGSHLTFLTVEMRKLLKHFVDVCQTIAFAHENGIIHRDLKPANIVTGQFGETYVIDWGLARKMGDDESENNDRESYGNSDSRLTQQGHSMGTPAYMSPEQVAGQNVGERSDIFNLGATLYAILVGQAPYQSDSLIENLKNAQLANFVRPQQVNPAVPAALSAICAKAMSADPQDRYESATLLAEEVECYLADLPIQAMATPWSDRIRRWLSRNRTAVTTLATTGMVGLVLLTIGNSLLLKSNRDLKQSEATAQRRLYSQLIAVANSELEKNNVVRAEEILERCPAEFRQWEWLLLKNLVAQNKPLVKLEFPGDQIRAMDLDEQGKLLAVGDSSGKVRVWNCEDWQLLQELEARLSVRTLCLVPNQNKVISGGTRKSRPEGRLSLVNLSTGELEERIGLKSQVVSCLAITRNGKFVVVGEFTWESTGKISIFAANSLKQIRSWEAHDDRINDLIIDESDKSILACGADGKVTCWDFEGNPLDSFIANERSLMSFDVHDEMITTAGSDNVVRVWQRAGSEKMGAKPIHTFAGHTDQVLSCSISPDQNFLATTGMDRDIHIWDLSSGRLSETIKRHSSHVRCVKFHPKSPLLFSAGEDRVVNVWGTKRFHKTKPTGMNLDFSDSDHQLLVVNDRQKLSVWNNEQQPVLRISEHPGPISGIATGSETVASLYAQGYCRLWNIQTGKLLGEFGDKDLKYLHAARIYDRDSKICLLHYNSIEIVDLEQNSSNVIQSEESPYRLDIDDQNRILAVGTRKGTLEIFGLDDHNPLIEINVSESPLLDISISPVRKQVAVASSDGSISVWQIESGEQVCKMKSGSSWLNCLDYTPDGKRIVSGNEHTLTCWDALSGQEIVSITMSRCVHEMSFNRDGSKLALASLEREGVPKATGPPDIKIFVAAPVDSATEAP